MQKKKLTLVIVSLLVVVLSVSLAYFTAQIIGEGKTVDVSSANLQIVFTDSDGALTETDIEPGWSATKTFTIKNDTKTEYKYNIVIKGLVNTFVTNGYLQYKITSTNDGYNMTEFKDVPKSETATDTALAYSVSIPKDVIQTYTIEFRYPNDTEVDQGDDMGKVLKGTLFIAEGSIPTLTEKLLLDNSARSERTDFSTLFKTNTANTLYKAKEDNTDVYYFAGQDTESTPINNWVKFGKKGTCFYNDMEVVYYDENSTSKYRETKNQEECVSSNVCDVGIVVVGVTDEKCTEIKGTLTGKKAVYDQTAQIYWRIIRTNSDGGVRLLYHGASAKSVISHIGDTPFNDDYNDIAYVSYMYGSTGSIENARNNQTISSTIKTYIDNWYASNMTSYTKYLSNSAVYCNDRSRPEYFFGAQIRLETNKTPTYDCAVKEDKFTVDSSVGNGKLTYPIALMTADEMAFAGTVYGAGESSTAWFYYNSANLPSTINGIWWSMSPYYYWMSDGGMGEMFASTSDDGNDFTYYFLGSSYRGNVRPVISLKSCVKYSSGDGTAENPYTILETESGC